MTEPAPTGQGVTPDPTPADPQQPTEPAPTADDIGRLQAALDKERGLRRDRDKELSDFRAQQKAAMTDADRAAAEAEERGAARVRSEYGSRLAQTEFKAAAAARNPGYDVAKALKYVNLAGMVGEDGEPDTKAIGAAVTDLIPEPTPGAPTPPSFDGGGRTPAPGGLSMSDLIRQATGRT